MARSISNCVRQLTASEKTKTKPINTEFRKSTCSRETIQKQNMVTSITHSLIHSTKPDPLLVQFPCLALDLNIPENKDPSTHTKHTDTLSKQSELSSWATSCFSRRTGVKGFWSEWWEGGDVWLKREFGYPILRDKFGKPARESYFRWYGEWPAWLRSSGWGKWKKNTYFYFD